MRKLGGQATEHGEAIYQQACCPRSLNSSIVPNFRIGTVITVPRRFRIGTAEKLAYRNFATKCHQIGQLGISWPSSYANFCVPLLLQFA